MEKASIYGGASGPQVGVGHWAVFSAVHSDIFGMRDTLSAQIRERDRIWSLVANVVGSVRAL
jgi:hypothetical protein